jgi:hypothetical protein
MSKRYTVTEPPYYSIRGQRHYLPSLPVGATFVTSDMAPIDADGDLFGHVEGDENSYQHVSRLCLVLVKPKKPKKPKVSEAAVLKSLDANLTIDEETAHRVLRVARLIDGK